MVQVELQPFQHTDYIVEIVTLNVHKFTVETQIVVWWDTNHILATSVRHRPKVVILYIYTT